MNKRTDADIILLAKESATEYGLVGEKLECYIQDFIKGFVKGEAKAKIKVATNLLSRGQDIAFTSEVTGLSATELQKLETKLHSSKPEKRF